MFPLSLLILFPELPPSATTRSSGHCKNHRKIQVGAPPARFPGSSLCQRCIHMSLEILHSPLCAPVLMFNPGYCISNLNVPFSSPTTSAALHRNPIFVYISWNETQHCGFSCPSATTRRGIPIPRCWISGWPLLGTGSCPLASLSSLFRFL